jgi:hypothetical protein
MYHFHFNKVLNPFSESGNEEMLHNSQSSYPDFQALKYKNYPEVKFPLIVLKA